MDKLREALKTVKQGDNLLKVSELRYLPRWIVLLIDLLICIFSLALSFLVIESLNVPVETTLSFFGKCAIIIGITVIFLFLFRTYAGIIRHSTFFDLLRILMALACATVSLLVLNQLVFWSTGNRIFHPTLILVYFGICCFLMFLFRMSVKQIFFFLMEYRRSNRRKRLWVVGIGEQSVAVARAVLDNPNIPFMVTGFVTKRQDYKQARLLGKKIYSYDKLVIAGNLSHYADALLVIKETMTKPELEDWTAVALENGCQILKAPTVQKIRNGDLVNEIREIEIEDLLNRKPITIENKAIEQRHKDKAVLVTGGAGSIGSEIVRQVAQFAPKIIVVVDQAETPLHEVGLELMQSFPDITFSFILADVTNRNRMESIFHEYNFSMVYHAAAYKHVPLVEDNPHEGICTNVVGSRILSELASKYKVNRFVMVSTDKAVNPTNVMGATKRTAELFVQSLQHVPGNTTKFITTRFGNVLGSNGSVIPHFKKQIQKGGPVTITHPDIVRYFMTIPEACELVLHAGTMGQGGEIYVFDMGNPVKIVDLARRMIKLSGLVPDEDIKIVYTGLRPGEKLYEELLSDDTRTLPTHHSSIMISKDAVMEFSKISQMVETLTEEAQRKDKEAIVKILKDIVPEFKSNNSVYVNLDK